VSRPGRSSITVPCTKYMTQVHSDMDWIPSSELTTYGPPDYVSRVDFPGFPLPSNSTTRASPVYE